MTMRISPPLKAVIVALPTAAWLVQSEASLGRALVLAAGAAFFAFAWIMFSPPRPAVAAAAPAAQASCSEHRHGEHRIDRRPTGRGARDLRCAATPLDGAGAPLGPALGGSRPEVRRLPAVGVGRAAGLPAARVGRRVRVL